MGFLTDLATHIKTWANGRFQTLLPTPAGNSGKVLTSDGTDYVLSTASSGGLTNFTEARTTTAPNATIPVHSINATGAETNIDLAIVPKGTGAILAQIPDGTAVGGNKRGSYTVDLQFSRTSATKVAAGMYSALLGGQNNMASGQHSAVLSGYSGTASGQYATVLSGYYNISNSVASAALSGKRTRAYLPGQIAFGNQGESDTARQGSIITFYTATNTATPVEAYMAGFARAVMPYNSAWAFDMEIVARSESSTQYAARFKRSGLITKGGAINSIALGGAVQTIGTDIINSNLAGCDVTISADTTNGSLKVVVTGIASTLIYWEAVAQLTELVI